MSAAFWVEMAICAAGLVVATALESPSLGVPLLFGSTLAVMGVIQRGRDPHYFDDALQWVANFKSAAH
jgi:hypothetical protein